MKNTEWINFIRHIMNMTAASGKKRIAYAIGNIIIMMLGVFFAVCIKWSWDYMLNSSFIVGIIVIIICCALTIFTFLQGFVSQFALVVISGIGIANPEERKYNVAAFIISLLTSVGLVAALVVLLLML